MRDIDFTSRDLYGNVTFAWKSDANSGIEILLQKIVTLAFSQNKKTYFNTIYGLDLASFGKYNFNSLGSHDFQMQVASDLLNLSNAIMAQDVAYNTPFADRLTNLSIKGISYDTKNRGVVLTLIVSTNSSNQLLTLPVK